MARAKNPDVQAWIDAQLDVHGDYREMLSDTNRIEAQLSKARQYLPEEVLRAKRGDQQAARNAELLATAIQAGELILENEQNIRRLRRRSRRHAVRIVS